MMTINRENLQTLLRASKCRVTFTKKDGTERVMLCTLVPAHLPPIVESDKPKKEREVNLDVLRVYDLEAEGWRSFRVDSVTAIMSVVG